MIFPDQFIAIAKKKKSRLIVGLDPNLTQFPQFLQKQLERHPTPERLQEVIFQFNRTIIQSTKQSAVAYKPQLAFYEQYGIPGLLALEQTLIYLQEEQQLIIMDGKRNDISHSARAYAQAWLGKKHPIFGHTNPWYSQALTINGYLGSDGILPFLEVEKTAGVFVLVKTSNPSSGELQDLQLSSGESIAVKMAQLVTKWGKEEIGESGYSRVGMVVGATYPELTATLRQHAPHALFLMPGIGVQGGAIESIVRASGKDQWGAYANVSRGILYALSPQELGHATWENTLRERSLQEAENAREALQNLYK